MIQARSQSVSTVVDLSVVKGVSKSTFEGDIEDESRKSDATIAPEKQQQLSFAAKWKDIQNNTAPKYHEYFIVEAKYHSNKDNMEENLRKSLDTKHEKDSKKQHGLVCYLAFYEWVPYVHTKYQVYVHQQPETWLKDFEADFGHLFEIVHGILQKYYGQTQVTKQAASIFRVLSEEITNSHKWKVVNNLFTKIASRLKTPLKQSKSLSPQIFDLPETVNDLVERVLPILKSLYTNKCLERKKLRVRELLKSLIDYKQLCLKAQATIQYCFLMSEHEGWEEILQYVLFFTKYQLQLGEIDRLTTIIDETRRLRGRDITGFGCEVAQRQRAQRELTRKSWRFLFGKYHCFEFASHVRAAHRQISWQHLVSWNFVGLRSKIPIKVDVEDNFVKVGLLVDDGSEEVGDCSACKSIADYSFATGAFRNMGQSCKKEIRYRDVKITSIAMEIREDRIVWEVACRQKGQQEAAEERSQVEMEFQYNPDLKYKMILSFKSGEIEIMLKD